MKYFFAVLFCALILTACDDGDLITADINLDSVTTVSKCSDTNTLYKVNGDQALLLNIDETNFPNTETLANTPRVVTLGTAASAVYRKYSGAVTATSFCSSSVPASPTVLEEWTITGGTIEITTVKILSDTNPTTVVGYNHAIVFKNVTFISTTGQEIAYPSKEFGNYRTDVIVLPFAFSAATTQKCTTKNLLFKYSGSEVLLFEVDPLLFVNAVTPIGSPRQRTIDGISNKVYYRIFNGGLNIDFFCAASQPALPTLKEEWISVNGIVGVSGIIRVETTATGTAPNQVFTHTIKLYKTTFKNGIKEFSPNATGDYVFGTYLTS
jgi:hypothetical protein